MLHVHGPLQCLLVTFPEPSTASHFTNLGDVASAINNSITAHQQPHILSVCEAKNGFAELRMSNA